MVDGGIHKLRFVGENTSLEVAVAGAFHSQTRTGEVGRSYVGHFEVEDYDLEMYPRAEDALKAGEENGISVEVLAKVRSRLLGVDKPDFPALRYQVRQDTQERPVTDIQILDIRRPDPQGPLYVRDPGNDLFEMGFVCDVIYHIANLRIIRENEVEKTPFGPFQDLFH